MTTAAAGVARGTVDKVAVRRSERAAAALRTLAERGHAQTGLQALLRRLAGEPSAAADLQAAVTEVLPNLVR